MAFGGILIRLVALQVVESPQDRQELLRQQESRLTTVVLPALRGSILDRTGASARPIGRGPLRLRRPHPGHNAPATAARAVAAARRPDVQADLLLTKHKRPDGVWSQFEYLARGVDIPTANRIAALNLSGIGESLDERRDEPGGDLASNLIGFTGDDQAGLEGIEARFNRVLRGADGENVYETGNPDTADGKLAAAIPGGYHRETPARPGSSVQLTIDRDLQFEVQQSLGDHLGQVHATMGAAVVLDVRTGEVLAQASYPPYNAAEPAGSTPLERADVATSQPYDPGFDPQGDHPRGGPAGGRDHAAVEHHGRPGAADRRRPVPGRRAAEVRDEAHHPRHPGAVVRRRHHPDRRPAGQGQAVRVPAEVRAGSGHRRGRAGRGGRPVAAAGPVERLGLRLGADRLQRRHHADADGGRLQRDRQRRHVRPAAPDQGHRRAGGKVTAGPAPQTHQVLTPAVASELRTILQAPVDVPGATGTRARIPNYLVAGKTGTASKLVDGQYTSNNSGSFIGMAPADHPRFVIGVYADVPTGSGGLVAAPAFSDMMSTTLWHYQVPPTTAPLPTFKIHP